MSMRLVSLVAFSLMATSAFADVYSDIANSIDFTGVIAGVGLIAVAIAGVAIAAKGAKLLLGFLGGR